MRTVRLLGLAAIAMCALGATGIARAEDPGSPSILCLVTGCAELTGTLTGKKSTLVTLKNTKTPEAEGVESKVTNCEAVPGTEGKDIQLCKDVSIAFTGVKVEGTKCSTEGDVSGTALMLLDLHIASETTAGGVLEPLLLAKLLNPKKEAQPITIKCGAVFKFEVKGTLGCLLLPGLKNVMTTEKLEISCKVKEKDPETGTCQQLCEWLSETPFEANLGSGFEDAWMELHAEGAPSKDVFIDD